MNPASTDQGYDYSSAGFDDFLSRSVDDLTQINLDAAGPQSTSFRFDSAQISGSLGDILAVGSIRLDGIKGRISVLDENGNEVVRLGELDD